MNAKLSDLERGERIAKKRFEDIGTQLKEARAHVKTLEEKWQEANIDYARARAKLVVAKSQQEQESR